MSADNPTTDEEEINFDEILVQIYNDVQKLKKGLK